MGHIPYPIFWAGKGDRYILTWGNISCPISAAAGGDG